MRCNRLQPSDTRDLAAATRTEWDDDKAASTSKKQNSFAEAATVFGDPMSVTFLDPDHSIDEDRYIAIGMSDSTECDRFPLRSGDRLRISAHGSRNLMTKGSKKENYVRNTTPRDPQWVVGK